MNKDILINQVAKDTNVSKSDATKSVNSIFTLITNSLKSGNHVRLVGFGTFLVVNRAATTGRNPRTGQSIQIPAKKVPKFRAGKALKESVNK
tara:strand:- start:392 stop:667 length:276 start_codon:yes stop_codon:yes gene_type:complete